MHAPMMWQRNVETNGAGSLNTDEAAWPVLICLLGPFRLFKKGCAIKILSDSKGAAVLAMLALRDGRPIAREMLLDTFWHSSEPDLASQALHSLVRDLNKRLRRELNGTALIAHEGGHYYLDKAIGIGVDVAIFDRLVAVGEQQRRAGDAAAAIDSFTRALHLYRGDLCIGTDVQASVEREWLRSQYLTLLAHISDDHYRRADYAASLASAQRLLAHDPCREDAHRLVMRCYARKGERAQALRQYQICAQVLHAEFDADPEPATTALFNLVRTDPGSI